MSGRSMKGIPAVVTALLLIAGTLAAAVPGLNPFLNGPDSHAIENEESDDSRDFDLAPYFSDPDGNEADPGQVIELLRCTLIRSVPEYGNEDCVINGEIIPVEAAPAVFPTAEQIRAEFQDAICGGNSAIDPMEAFCDEDALSDPLSQQPIPSDLPTLPAPPSLVVPADDHTLLEQILNLIEDAEHVPINVFCQAVFPTIEDLANHDVFGESPPPTGDCRQDDEGNWDYDRPSNNELGEWAPEIELPDDPSDHYETIDELYDIAQVSVIQPTFETLCNTLLTFWEANGHDDYTLYCTDEIAGPDGEPIDFQTLEECKVRDQEPEEHGGCDEMNDWGYDGPLEEDELTILDRDGDERADAWRIQVVCTVYTSGLAGWDENCSLGAQTEPARHHCISSDYLWGGSENQTGMVVTGSSCIMRIAGAVWVIDEETERLHLQVYDGFDDRYLYSRLTFDAFAEDQDLIIFQILDKNDEGEDTSDRFIQFNEGFWPLSNTVCGGLDPLGPDDDGGDAIVPSTLRPVYEAIGYEDRSCNVGWEAPTDFGWLVLSNPGDLDGDGVPTVEELTGIEDEQDPGELTDWLNQFDPTDPRYDDLVAMTFRTSNPLNFMATPFNPLADPCVVPEGEINPCIMPVKEVDVEFTQVQPGVEPLRDDDFPYTVWGTVEVDYHVKPTNDLVNNPSLGPDFSSWRIFETSEPVPSDPAKQSDLCGATESFLITDSGIDFACTGEEAWSFGNHDRVRYLFLELCAAPEPVFGKDHLPEICVKNIPNDAKLAEDPPFDPPEEVLWDPEAWESRKPNEEALDSPGIIVHVWNQPAVQITEWIPYGFPANPPTYWPQEVKQEIGDGQECDRNVDTSNSQTDWHCGFAELVVTAYHPAEETDFIRTSMCLQAPNRNGNQPATVCRTQNFEWPEIRGGGSSRHEMTLLESPSLFENDHPEGKAGTFVFLHDTREYPHPRDKSTHEDATTQGSGIKVSADAELDLLDTKQSQKNWRPDGEGRGGHLCVSNSCWIRVFHNEPPELRSLDARVIEPHEEDPVMDIVAPPSDDNPTDERVIAFEFEYRDMDRNPFAAPTGITIEIFDEDNDELLHTVTDDDPSSRSWPDSPCRRTSTDTARWHRWEELQCIWDMKDSSGEIVNAATVKWQVTAVDGDAGPNSFVSDLLDLNIVPLPDLFNGFHETEPLPTYFGDHRVDFQVTYDGHNFAPGRDEGGNETVYVELERLDGAENEQRTVQMKRCRVQTDESGSKAVFCAERELFPDGSEWEYRFRAENERGREAYDPPLDQDPYELDLETVCRIAGMPVTEYCHDYDELLRDHAQALQDEVNSHFWGPIHTFNDAEIAAPWGEDVCLMGVDVCLYPDEDGDLVPDLVEEWLLQTEVVNTMNEPQGEPVFQFYEDIRIAVCQPDTSSLPLPRECEFPLVEVTLSEEGGASTLSVCMDDGECHIEGVTVHAVDFQVTLLGLEIHAFGEDGEEVFFLIADGTRTGSGSSPILSFGAQTIDHSISANVLSNPIDVCLEGTGGFTSLDDLCVYPGSAPPVGIEPQADGSFCLLRYPIGGSGQPQEICPLVLSTDDIPDNPDVPDPEQESVNLVCGTFEPEGCEEGEDGNWTYTPTVPTTPDPTNPNDVFGAIGENEEFNCGEHTNWVSWLNRMLTDPDCERS